MMSPAATTERDALIRAIIANPEDDAPRLVYADWLEEHATTEGTERDRAEFIRVQCARSRLRYGRPEDEARAGKLQTRNAELWNRHKEAWVSELNLPKNRHTYCWFRRGMVADVWCTVRYFAEHADRIHDSAPVESVCLRMATARNVAELARHPRFSRVRGVEFSLDETPAEVVARFFETVPTSHLRAVCLTTRMVNSLSPLWHTRNVSLARTLARCPGLANLKCLRLGHGGIGDEGGLALAHSPHLGGLEFLGLNAVALSPKVEAALRQRFGGRLCLGRLDFPNFTLGELGWA